MERYISVSKRLSTPDERPLALHVAGSGGGSGVCQGGILRIDNPFTHRTRRCNVAPPIVSDGSPLRKSKRAQRAARKTFYLVVWWMSQNPYAAIFENRLAAEAAANVRNAILITVRGGETEIPEIVDWYRRDPEGNPMPVEWRDLAGQVRVPWTFKTIDQSEVEAAA